MSLTKYPKSLRKIVFAYIKGAILASIVWSLIWIPVALFTNAEYLDFLKLAWFFALIHVAHSQNTETIICHERLQRQLYLSLPGAADPDSELKRAVDDVVNVKLDYWDKDELRSALLSNF